MRLCLALNMNILMIPRMQTIAGNGDILKQANVYSLQTKNTCFVIVIRTLHTCLFSPCFP